MSAAMLSAHYLDDAARYCSEKDVLELACGAGLGLGYFARGAHRVVGGDYTQWMLSCARRHYGDRIALVRLDAHRLSFEGKQF